MSKAIYKSNRDIPEHMLLGNMSFIRLCDMKITRDELLNIFRRNHLSENYINNFSPSDVFRRATSSVKNMTFSINKDKIRIEVDEITKYAAIKRVIGFKKVDDTENIHYLPIAVATFDKITRTISVEPTDTYENHVYTQELKEIAKNLCSLIKDRYTEWSQYHNIDTIRNITTKMITDMHPINLMTTGICKFIPYSYSEDLYNIKNALIELNQYTIKSTETNAMEMIPIIDTEEQRQLIDKVFTSEVQQEMSELSKELHDIIQQKGSISKSKATSFINKFNMLQEKNKEYESMLSTYSDIIHKQIKNMFVLIDENKK